MRKRDGLCTSTPQHRRDGMNGRDMQSLRTAMGWTPRMLADEIGASLEWVIDAEKFSREIQPDLADAVTRGYRRWLALLCGAELKKADPREFENKHELRVYNSARAEQLLVYELRKGRQREYESFKLV